jgi:hypothetical protein
MSAEILKRFEKHFIVQIKVPYSKSMLENEDLLLSCLNEVGQVATGEILTQFDTDGTPISVGNQTFTSKGQVQTSYQTPYGPVKVERHVYQSHSGGKTYVPLEKDARIVITSTPRFAKMITSKISESSVASVKRDFTENHNRPINNKTLQDITEAVGVFAAVKENVWEYAIPELDKKVHGIGIGLDGACMLMKDDGWRVAMTGAISLYDKDGERLHTAYYASAPEYGKEKFKSKFENEILKIKGNFPNVTSVGVADGARDNWPLLEKHTDFQILDFYHATIYIGEYAQERLKNAAEREEWLEVNLHKLKHNSGGVVRLLTEIINNPVKNKNVQDKVVTYIQNHSHQMKYNKMVDRNLPIGSGVIEAACKTIIKQRMCKSGSRWTEDGAEIILTLRCLNNTDGKWDQFWNKINRYGFERIAV